ncbi:hypothetical protein C0Q70_16496 [Pomacea canaliculata]|uniref:MAM domain-containing protein n=1 Tax=Pomacea canaliculata TaxID=400727 RepID=A0A2T7NQ07_POMCA|nr:hypothetical protein C0Q70_16496 [Pomacea canaliculata]
MAVGQGGRAQAHGTQDRCQQLRVNITEIPGLTNRTWLCANISLHQARQNVQVFVEAETGDNILGETAVDIVFIDDNCNAGSMCQQSLTPESTTTSSTITFMMSTTSTSGDSTASSSTAITSSGADNNNGEFDTNLLYILIAPLVVLIAAVVIAVVCFRRREKPRHPPEETETVDETYDLPNDDEMRGQNTYVTPTDNYDSIKDTNL